MVDDATFRRLHGGGTDSLAQGGDLSEEAMNSESPPDDPFLLLLPANIRGYGMHDKQWSTYDFFFKHEFRNPNPSWA